VGLETSCAMDPVTPGRAVARLGRSEGNEVGHSKLGITSIHMQGIDNTAIIETVHARRAPMIPVHADATRKAGRRQGQHGHRRDDGTDGSPAPAVGIDPNSY
jgi:hypothetical protein